MATMQVLGTTKLPYPYSEPTVAWKLLIENGGKAETFVLPMGPAWHGGPRDVDQAITDLNEMAENEYSDVDELAAMLDSRRMAKALVRLGAEINTKLERIGLRTAE